MEENNTFMVQKLKPITQQTHIVGFYKINQLEGKTLLTAVNKDCFLDCNEKTQRMLLRKRKEGKSWLLSTQGKLIREYNNEFIFAEFNKQGSHFVANFHNNDIKM